MSKLDNITNKIVEDAKEKANEIINKANDEKAKFIDEKLQEAVLHCKEIVDRATLESTSIVDKAVSSAKLKSRDDILIAKQEVIEDVLNKVKEQLSQLPADEFVPYVEKFVKDIDLKEDFTIVVPEKYKGEFKNSSLKDKLDSETINSGFKIKAGNLNYNNSFDAIVDSNKEELENIIIGELFAN